MAIDDDLDECEDCGREILANASGLCDDCREEFEAAVYADEQARVNWWLSLSDREWDDFIRREF